MDSLCPKNSTNVDKKHCKEMLNVNGNQNVFHFVSQQYTIERGDWDKIDHQKTKKLKSDHVI